MFKRAAEPADLPGAPKTSRPAEPVETDEEQILDLTVVAGGKYRGGLTSSSSPAAEESATTLIGEDVTVVGNLSSPGNIQVSGKVHGDVACRHLMVDKTAQIIGGIVADEVIIDGCVTGPVRALRVTLRSGARVEGEICYQSFAVDKGAEFEGMAHRSDDPKRAAIDAAVAFMAGSNAVEPEPGPEQTAPWPSEQAEGGLTLMHAG